MNSLKLTVVICVIFVASAFATSQDKFVTGEDMVYKVNSSERLGPYDTETDSENFWAIDPVKLTLNSVYLRHLIEYDKGYVAIYATVQADDQPLNVTKTVFFQELELTGDATLNLTDRIIYGPELYTGKPLRLRIAIIQLDPEKYRREINTFKKLNQVPKGQGAHYEYVMKTCAAICEEIIHTDKTAVEFFHDLTFHPVVTTGIHNKKANDTRNLTLYPDTYVIMKKEKEYRRDSLIKRLTVNWIIDLFGRRADGGDVQPESYKLLPLRQSDVAFIAGKIDNPKSPNYEYRKNTYVILTLTKGDDYVLTDINKEIERIGVKYMNMLSELDYDVLRDEAIERASEFLQINENVMTALKHARRFQKPKDRVNALIEGLTPEKTIAALQASKKNIAIGTNKDIIGYLEKTTQLHFRTASDWIRRHNQITYNINTKQWEDKSSAAKTDFIKSIFNDGDNVDINDIISEDISDKK